MILGDTLLGLGTLITYINLALMELLEIEMTVTKTGKELQDRTVSREQLAETGT